MIQPFLTVIGTVSTMASADFLNFFEHLHVRLCSVLRVFSDLRG